MRTGVLGPGPFSSHPYSPECVEGEFSEVREVTGAYAHRTRRSPP